MSRQGGNSTIRNLLHRNLEVEIFRMKSSVQPFGTGRAQGSLILEEENFLLYILLVPGKPFYTIDQLLPLGQVKLITADVSESMLKSVYDSVDDGTNAVDKSRSLVYKIDPDPPVEMNAETVISHVNDEATPADPLAGPHSINYKANLTGDIGIVFDVGNPEDGKKELYNAVDFRHYWNIQWENASGNPVIPAGPMSNYLWKGFTTVKPSNIYPVIGLNIKQLGWFWIVTNTIADDGSGRDWKAGQYMVYNGTGDGSLATDWDKLDVQDIIGTPTPVTSFTGLDDVPSDYTGYSEKVVSVKTDESGLEFTDKEPETSFMGLTDTPAGYAGQGGKTVTVKITEDGLEYKLLSSLEKDFLIYGGYGVDGQEDLIIGENINDSICVYINGDIISDNKYNYKPNTNYITLNTPLLTNDEWRITIYTTESP